MKVWNSYGSEHSSALVLIGRFKSIEEAQDVKTTIEEIRRLVTKEEDEDPTDYFEPPRRFTDEMRELLNKHHIFDVSRVDVKQFYWDFDLVRNGSAIKVKTEETDVSSFLKVMIAKRGRVEVYSMHDYPGDEPAENSDVETSDSPTT